MPEISLAALRSLLPQGGDESYDPFAAEKFVNPAVDAMGRGIGQQVATPGKLMAPNPWPEGSEPWQWYEDSKRSAAMNWAPEMALQMIGSPALGGVSAGGTEAVLGSGAIRTKPGPGAVEAGNPYGGVYDRGVSDVGNLMVRHTDVGPMLGQSPSGATHGFSGVKSGSVPIDEMDYALRGAALKANPVWNIADLEGKEMVLGVTDRTRGGGELTRVGKTNLETPIAMEGGISYPTLHEGSSVPGVTDPNALRLYANSPGAATQINNLAASVIERGRDPIFTTVTMAKEAGDSSKQMARTAYQVARQAEPTAGTIGVIDETMATRLKDIKGKPSTPYPGFASPDLAAWLENEGGPFRAAFVKSLDTAKARKGGIPDIGEVRYANTDPRLVGTPTGASGMLMGRMRPDLGTVADSRHATYPTSFLGEQGALGGLQGNVPFHILNPDLHRHLLQSGDPQRFANAPAYYTMMGMPGGIPKTQVVTPEVVDKVSEFFRKHPQGWGIAGAAPVGGLMSLQALRDQQQPQ